MAHPGVAEYRIGGRHQPVHDHRISPVLKIPVSADIVHHNEILADTHCQMGDGPVKPLGMETALFPVGNQPLHVFQRTGDFRLTVPLHHRHIDEKIQLFCLVTDGQLHPGAVVNRGRILLHIQKRHAVCFRNPVITAYLHCFRRPVPHPGALQHHQIFKTVFFQIFDNPFHHFRMGGGPPGCLRGGYQVGLDADSGLLIRNPLPELCFCEQLFCHFFIVCSVNHQNIILFH